MKVQIDTRFSADEVYADYLEAALSMVIRDEPESEKVVRGVITNEAEGSKPPSLLSCMKPFEQLSHLEFPQTALARARIYLWAYIKVSTQVARWPGKQKRDLDFQQKDSEALKAADSFYTPFRKLLKEVEVEKIPVEELPSIQLYIEWLRTPPEAMKTPGKDLPDVKLYLAWLRTHWQKIHYLACNGISEPRSERIREIVETYTQVRPLTAWVLQAYLYAHEEPNRGLNVDSDWLTTWLVSNVLMSQRLAEYYGLGKTGGEAIASPAEEMNYFAHFSHLVLYTLHCARHLHREKKLQEELKREVKIRRLPFAEVAGDLSPSLSETQLYMLSEYAYREIGVHRELLLLERLTRQLRYELPLYAASEFYRDHLYHVIDVCLLGELLLRSRVSARANGDSSLTLVKGFGVGTAPERVQLLMKNWYVAALCHDLGYVVERARNLLEPVRTINGPGLDEFWKAVEDGLKCGSEEISRLVKLKLPYSANGTGLIDDLKKVEATDHGIAGWLHLNHWLDQAKVSPDEMIYALNAIVRHNLPEQRVSCRYEPLTLLLMLCDHLQEWGRPRIGPDPLATGVMEVLRFSEQPNFEQKVRVKRLFIEGLKTIPPEHPDLIPEICKECWETKNCRSHCLRLQTRIEEKDGLEFKLKHVEAREGDFEPAISWLLMCRDLQCFGDQDKDLPFNIKITMEHTPPRIWEVFSWQPLEMDLLQEFASSYERATYLCEWVEKARLKKDGIEYNGDRANGSETFTIHLNQLGRPLPRGLSDEHWKQFFKWKWRRLGQQFINLGLGAWFPDS